jgi:hypothetical protein
MTLRGADWYRTEAAHFRDKADAVKGDTVLQNSYLALAQEYDRIADTLEQRSSRAWRLGRSA